MTDKDVRTPVVGPGDNELKKTLRIHVKIECILKNPGLSEGEISVKVDDIMNRLSADQVRAIHSCLLRNDDNTIKPAINPYEYALKLLGDT